MSIVKNFNNFGEAEEFEKLLKKYGATTKMYACWSGKQKEYIITVSAVVK